jgi:hypothetical protein
MTTETTRQPITVYFTMVHTPHGVKRVGDAFRSETAAKGWVSFVRGAWRGCRVSVRSMTLRFGPDGRIDAETRKRLDEEFNLDPPADSVLSGGE